MDSQINMYCSFCLNIIEKKTHPQVNSSFFIPKENYSDANNELPTRMYFSV